MSAQPLVVVVGPPAAGKTRVAKRLGKIFGVSVVDTDTLVSSRWGSIPDIFEIQGEQFFHERTLVVLQTLSDAGGIDGDECHAVLIEISSGIWIQDCTTTE